jgi:hypothetical protein
MKRVRLLSSARRELLAAVLHYNESEADLGVKFVRAVGQALAFAVRFPSASTHGPVETRVMVSGSPNSVGYLQDDAGIVVVALAHSPRRPGLLDRSLRTRLAIRRRISVNEQSGLFGVVWQTHGNVSRKPEKCPKRDTENPARETLSFNKRAPLSGSLIPIDQQHPLGSR